MITYELARDLKNAGFPIKKCPNALPCYYIKHNGAFKIGHVPVGDFAIEDFEASAYIPTLAELIEACGDKFILIERISDETGVYFWAKGKYAPSLSGLEVSGSNPEEAVANLYLALNPIK